MKTALLLMTLGIIVLPVLACESKRTGSNPLTYSLTSAHLATVPSGFEPGDITFSPDGRHVACAVKKDGRAAMMVDATVSPLYDEVTRPAFRAGTDQYAFVAHRGTGQCVVVNGSEGTWYEAVTSPRFAPDGRILYAARRKDGWVLVAGSSTSAPFQAVSDPQPFISPDGKRVAHEQLDPARNKVFLVVSNIDFSNPIKGGEFDSLSTIRGDFSPGRLVYSAARGGKKTVVVLDFTAPGCSEKTGPWYDDIAKFTLSSDGRHLAYFATRDKKPVMVVDGGEQELPALDMTLDVVSSVTGSALFTGVIKDHVVSYLNGKDTGNRYDTVEHLSFSPDGRHYAFVAGHGDSFNVVVDGHPGPTFERVVTPLFSPDGASLLYRARKGGQRFVVKADLQGRTVREYPRHDAVWETSFSPDGKQVGYGVQDGRDLSWQVERL